ncbi:hypothetical protein [Gemmata massiliana]|uniref:hypothetical protein n=1 Tax=Gemmata massiliana TaxID=1210884 RepID=UPI0013A6DBFD|nr:hypothetical protein [Gemmata massiliana]
MSCLSPPDNATQPEAARAEPTPEHTSHLVDPARSAAGRLGGKRVHQLAALGRVYEQEHGLKAGRQRLKQLVQLGWKYELEHGLRAVKPRRRKKGYAWQEFFTALARVVKPEYRPAIEQLVRPALEGGSAPGRAA